MRLAILALALLGATAAFADDAPKKLTSMDLAVQTHKWDGKLIQTTGQCFFADKDEYRCAVAPPMESGMVRVDFTTIEPEAMKQLIEYNCDTLQKWATHACSVNMTFTYEAAERKDNANGTTTMYILATENKGVFSKAK